MNVLCEKFCALAQKGLKSANEKNIVCNQSEIISCMYLIAAIMLALDYIPVPTLAGSTMAFTDFAASAKVVLSRIHSASDNWVRAQAGLASVCSSRAWC